MTIIEMCEHQDLLEKQKFVIADPEKYTVARLDGRSFTRLSKQLTRPFDEHFSDAMKAAAIVLLEDFHPMLVYVSSDEITVVFDKQFNLFGGRSDKLVSVLAGKASSAFSISLHEFYPAIVHDVLSSFDCRIWQVDTGIEWMENLIVRQHGSIKNSVSMLAYAHLPKKSLVGVSHQDRRSRLIDIGVNWQDEKPHDKWGTFIFKKQQVVAMTDDIRSKIPEGKVVPDTIIRSVVVEYNEAPISTNPITFIKTFYEMVSSSDPQ